MSLVTKFSNEVLSRVNSSNSIIFASETLLNFFVSRPLYIKLSAYIDHFLYQLNLSEDLLIWAYMLLEKTFTVLSEFNIHRIVFTAVVLAYKFIEDHIVSNILLEKIGVLKQGELKVLEISFLTEFGCDFCIDKYEEKVFFFSIIEICEESLEKNDGDENNFEVFGMDDETNDSFSELSAFFH